MQLYRQANTDGQDAQLLSLAARWPIRRVLATCSIPGTPAGAVLAIPRWRGFCWFLAGLFVAEFLRLRGRGEMESALLNSCVECARVTLKGV